MAAFTISSASTLAHCRYPFRIDVEMPQQGTPDAAQSKGTGVHAAIAAYANKGDLPSGELGPTWDCALAWVKANWKQSWVAEPAYAWDPSTDAARLLGVDIGRDYAAHGRRPGEVAGTLDVCSVEGDTVYVYEFGTGHDVSHKFQQLRLQCAVAALAHGCSRAVGQLVRFADDGTYPGQPVELDEFALAAIRGEFAEILLEVPGSSPVPGEHCSRCNLAPVCPAAAPIVEALVPVEALVSHRWGLTISSPDHAAWLLAMARLVAAAAEAVKEQVKAYVPKDGLLLEDGSLLIEAMRNVNRKNHARIEALATALGATDEQLEACSVVVQESAGLRVKKPAKLKRARAA